VTYVATYVVTFTGNADVPNRTLHKIWTLVQII